MKKRSEHRAGFFKRTLSMLLVIVMVVSTPGMASAAAGVSRKGTGAAAELVLRKPVQMVLRNSQQHRQLSLQQKGSSRAVLLAGQIDGTTGDSAGSTGEDANTAGENTGTTGEGTGTDTTGDGTGSTGEGTGTDTTGGSPSTEIDFSGYQASELHIYNHLRYTNASNKVELSAGSYVITGKNESQPIIAGNHPIDSDGETKPLEYDIPVSLKGLTMTKDVIIKPVGPDNSQKVVLTVTEASSLAALVVEENASLELILDADLTAASITLGANSRLEISGSGSLTVSGEFCSGGTVALNGGTIQADQGLSAVELSLNETKVKANAQAVTATKTLSMTDSTVENASLFGYIEAEDGSEEKEKTLVFSGEKNEFINVTAVGCSADSSLRLSVEGTVTSSSGTTTYYRDYSITYLQSDGSAIEPGEDWPAAYRVSSSSTIFSSGVICGWHTNSQYTKIEEDAEKQIPLPELPSEPGYEHQGWKLEDSEEPVKAITAISEDITLTAEFKASQVTVKLDRGYDPDQYTNDKDADGKFPDRETTQVSEINGKISLPVPVRFGYVFKGWKITSGANPGMLPNSDSYTVAMDNCNTDEEGKHIVTMEAQWEAAQFGLTLFLGTTVSSSSNVEISLDGGNTFQKLSTLSAYSGVTVTGLNILFSGITHPITYGQNISEYLKSVFPDLPEGTLPILKDIRGAGEVQTFAGWKNITGAVNGTTRFLYGENGMLAPGKLTLEGYQRELKNSNAAVNAAWGAMSYGLKLPETMPSGWTLTYTGEDGKQATIQAGTKLEGAIMVQENTPVTLTTSATKPENFSLWGFKKDNGGRIFPAEQENRAGASKLTYKFTMPAANVTATYSKGKDVWINIARSPIEFVENKGFNNRKCNGFWYAGEIDELTPLFEGSKADVVLVGRNDEEDKELFEKTYFYQWDFGDKFCVTSKDIATKNQLTLVNELTKGVYFKELNLTMRDAYVAGAVGSLINNVDCEITNDGPITADKIAEVALTDYANIIVDNRSRQSYTTTLHFVGPNNTVGAIMPDTLRANTNNQNQLTIEGDSRDSSTLNLGAAFGNFTYTVRNITINEYIKEDGQEDFKYLIHSSNWSCSVTNAAIKAKDKSLHVGNSSFYFTNAKVELRSINAYGGATLTNASYLRIRDNLLLGYVPLKFEKNSKVVIDGNLEMNYQHWSTAGDITDGTNNWLVVKGNRCDLTNFKWCSGTLVCNALIFGRCGGVSGGTVVTNQILSQPVGFWKYDDKTHAYNHAAVNSQTEKASSNEDDYPFAVFAQKREGVDVYSFSGGKTYLLGYYKTSADKTYDAAVTALDKDNPVEPFMAGLLDENGDLVPNPSVDTGAAEQAVRNSSYRDNECVVLGNSTYNTGVRSRSVSISGNAEIYAAGNITFFNDTTVEGGSVYCSGSFGTKGDLTVNGGAITAETVGNAYNLKTVLEDGTLRWRRTNIQGGTIKANRIGAFENTVSKSNVTPRSTVTVKNSSSIVGTPEIDHDVYINYIFDKTLFNNDRTPKNPETLRFTVTWAEGKAFGAQSWQNEKLTFTPPNVVGGAAGETGFWKWDSLTGDMVDTVATNGIPQFEGANLSTNAYNRIQMKLYAVKESYNLIFKVGAAEVGGVTCDGSPLDLPKNDGDKRSAKASKEVVLTFNNPDMAKDYTVLWYVDGSGIIHNVPTTRDDSGKITFPMPAADVEVYSTKDLILDLDNASYTLTQDGFRTESNETPKREDSLFHYLGNLIIQQGSIQEIVFDPINETDQPVSVKKSDKGTKEEVISTLHDIRVKADFDNSTNDRTVTLRHIYQTGDSNSVGIYMEEGAKANFTLDGPIRICRVRVPEGADFGLSGKNGAGTDAFYPFVMGEQASSNWASLGNYYGAAGNITLKDLTILGKKNGVSGWFCYGSDKEDGQPVEATNTVAFVGCEYQTCKYWYSGSYFAKNAKKVIFEGGKFTIKRAENWPSPFFENCGDVEIRNGANITVTESGSSKAATRPFYYGIKNRLVIDDAAVSLSMRVPGTNDYLMYQSVNDIAPVIELKNGASLTLDQHARLKRLVIGGSSEGTSTVKVGTNGDGYLLCPDIEVNDGGALNAGGIIVSGFYDASHATMDKPAELQKEENFQTDMGGGKNIYDAGKKGGRGLVVNGGAVTATEYITGDVNGKVTVNGGSVTAPDIGTTGGLYGYTQYVPMQGEDYIYIYEKVPAEHAMTVNVTGGEVQVSDYLGGMRTDVNISGGTVTLGENAVLGLTEKQQETLTHYCTSHDEKLESFGSLTVTGGEVKGAVNEAAGKGGSIRMPYGTVDVSGADTGISVYDMSAYCGDITISGATGAGGAGYKNPYKDSDRKHDTVGVEVLNELLAQNLTIADGSVVFAGCICPDANEDDKGTFKITDAYAYSWDYLVPREFESQFIDSKDPVNQNLFGQRMVEVIYYLHPGFEDVFLSGDVGKETNLDKELKNYKTSKREELGFLGASCSGYKFLGWYVYDPDNKEFVKDAEGNDQKIETIDTGEKSLGPNPYELCLVAKWERVKVVFEIQIEVEESEFNPETMEFLAKGEGRKNLYRFKEQIANIEYGEPIFTPNGYQLSGPYFRTKTTSPEEVVYGDNWLISEGTSGNVVTSTMADDYVKGGENKPLILMVKHGQVVRTLITLDQNKNGKGNPKDTKFNLNLTLDNQSEIAAGNDDSAQVSAYMENEKQLKDITAFVRNDELIVPTAPGYTFGGWYTDPAGSQKQITAGESVGILHENGTTTLYAKWTPNQYLVQFSANTKVDDPFSNSQWVTPDNTAPAVGDSKVDWLNYYWTYDAAPSDGNGFCLEKEDGNLKELPHAWREGYVFDYWQFTDSEGKEHKVIDQDELNKAVMENLEVWNYRGGEDCNGKPALTLYAHYHPARVSYELNGGKWTGEVPTPEPAYGDALAGYKKDSEITGTGFDKLGEDISADGSTKYYVLSTTKDYFEKEFKPEVSGSGYVPDDYREVLSHKGYTFQGWLKAPGEETDPEDGLKPEEKPDYYGCAPRFEDLELIADWKANVYDLKLHVKDGDYNAYEAEFKNKTESPVEIKDVTVGSRISTDVWPKREDWYAFDKGEEDDEKNRLLLGATFAGLDPGDSRHTDPKSVYRCYAEAVIRMLNSKTMFSNGDVFTLPEDEVYEKDLGEATVTRPMMSRVPDYPTGSEIPVYGVYRERSLVFIEEYVDPEGVSQSQVMCSYPWSQYTDYPYNVYPDDEPRNSHYNWLKGQGYTLVNWYVGSNTIDEGRQYPRPENKNLFYERIEGWKNNQEAGISDGYDINVYTAYVAQKKVPLTLRANSDPTKEASASVSYVLPGSMQEGKLSYQISELNNLNLVSKEEMIKHQYDDAWEAEDGTPCTADDTVAIELRLAKDGKFLGEPVTLEQGEKQQLGEQAIGAGWQLMLTMYHSKVMTAENSYPFDIEYTFYKKAIDKESNQLEYQRLTEEVTVELTPSLYDVDYRVNLPEPEGQLKLTQPEDHTFKKVTGEEAYCCTVKQGYGSDLLPANQTLMLEGYNREENWYYDTGTEEAEKPALGKLNLHGISDLTKDERIAELEDGRIPVYTGYTPKAYTLEKDDTVPDDAWKITYGDGVDHPDTLTTLGASKADVKYHSKVTLTPAPDRPVLDLTLTIKYEADSKTGDETGSEAGGETDNETGSKISKVISGSLDYLVEENLVTPHDDGSYTFVMPAANVTISSLWGLYLDYGTIELYRNGFKQEEKYGEGLIEWPGGYRILQCEDDNWGTYPVGTTAFHETENVLKLYGDLTTREDTQDERKIILGRLNIVQGDSIELMEEGGVGNVILTQEGRLQVKNILVPEGTCLTMKRPDQTDEPNQEESVIGTEALPQKDEPATLTLAPDSGAAIGGSTENWRNGSITLENLEVIMTLNTSSVASGIGPGKPDSTDSGIGAIVVQNCKITVKESKGSDKSGEHTWIGGAGVPSVRISNTVMPGGSGAEAAEGTKAVDGTTVALENCHIGEEDTPIKALFHAGDRLTIKKCKIYQ